MNDSFPGHNIEGVHVKAYALKSGEQQFFVEVELWTEIGNRKITWASHRFPALSLDHAIKVANAYNEVP